MAERGRRRQRRDPLATLALRVDVGSAVEEHEGDIGVSALRRESQCGEADVGLGVWIGTTVHQRSGNVSMPTLSGSHQWRDT